MWMFLLRSIRLEWANKILLSSAKRIGADVSNLHKAGKFIVIGWVPDHISMFDRHPLLYLPRKLFRLGIKHLTGLNMVMIVPLFSVLYCQPSKEELTYMKDNKYLIVKLSIQVWQFFMSFRRHDVTFTQLRLNHTLDTWTFVIWWAFTILFILRGTPFCSAYSHKSCMVRNSVSFIFMACCVTCLVMIIIVCRMFLIFMHSMGFCCLIYEQWMTFQNFNLLYHSSDL